VPTATPLRADEVIEETASGHSAAVLRLATRRLGECRLSVEGCPCGYGRQHVRCTQMSCRLDAPPNSAASGQNRLSRPCQDGRNGLIAAAAAIIENGRFHQVMIWLK